MRHAKLADMVGGWFIGDFSPAALRTKAAEVAHKTHHAGERWNAHVHRIATEVNLVTEGSCVINGATYRAGDIFVIEPGEVAVPEFPERCAMVVVKIPSVPGDKYTVVSDVVA